MDDDQDELNTWLLKVLAAVALALAGGQILGALLSFIIWVMR